MIPHDSLVELMGFNDPNPLFRAAEEGDDHIIWLLLTRSDLHADLMHEKDSYTPLVLAVKGRHESTIKLSTIEAQKSIRSMAWCCLPRSKTNG